MLGFAMRAGRVVIGTDLVCKSMSRSGKDKPRLILLSEGASEGARKKIRTKAEFYGIDLVTVNLSPDELGRLLGKTTTPVTVAIIDDGFAREIRLAAKEKQSAHTEEEN